jgi:hypothetical protein
VQRTRITADEQAAARHEGAELRKIEFPEIHDAV